MEPGKGAALFKKDPVCEGPASGQLKAPSIDQSRVVSGLNYVDRTCFGLLGAPGFEIDTGSRSPWVQSTQILGILGLYMRHSNYGLGGASTWTLRG